MLVGGWRAKEARSKLRNGLHVAKNSTNDDFLNYRERKLKMNRVKMKMKHDFIAYR